MRIFQEEIFGPVVSVARFSDYNGAMEIANDTLYGLGAGVWSRNGNTAYRAGQENHAMMLDHYQQAKNLLVSHSENKLDFF